MLLLSLEFNFFVPSLFWLLDLCFCWKQLIMWWAISWSFKQEKREFLNSKLNKFAHSIIFLGQRTNSWKTWNKSTHSFTCPTNLICAQARLNRGFCTQDKIGNYFFLSIKGIVNEKFWHMEQKWISLKERQFTNELVRNSKLLSLKVLLLFWH